MNKEQASTLITKTFNSAFDLSKYRNFIINLFDDIDTEKQFTCSRQYLKTPFKDTVSSYGRIGKYKDPNGKEIEALWVNLKKCDNITKARTLQRNFIAWYLNGGRGGALRDAAVVAFYNEENPSDWRFSFVKLDTIFKDFKVDMDFTPPKRYSFLVGENEPNHTAKSRLVSLLEKNNPSVDEIEAAFNIENVSKEFFTHYKELFLVLLENLQEMRKKDPILDLAIVDIKNADFCKKLLGQLVFLYFIQKKGWLGVAKNNSWGKGDKAFLRHTFERAIKDGKNFFNDYLEPLFYNALANGERDDNWFELLECRIPFLNGGLFEPIYDWVNTDIIFDNSIFSNDKESSEGDKGTGILDVFDRYNFTVKEDEPLEKEVAVDPEMLGKVFENLLEVDDRKSKGAFYTPREIVHYMCQESLINYLCNKLDAVDSDSDKFEIPETQKTFDIDEQQSLKSPLLKSDIASFIRNSDKIVHTGFEIQGKEQKVWQKEVSALKPFAKALDSALENIKICDPAIGSGAFPVGMLNEIVKARRALVEGGFLREAQKRTIYEYKRQAIQKSIYGVDIESGAIDIAKLRLWLSLVVDEDDFKNIKPLPNLDYKIVCGNSLLRMPSQLSFETQPLIKEFEELKPKFFDASQKGEKRDLKRRIDVILKKLLKGDVFDFTIFFSEVFDSNGGFDVIIGNPPYIQLQKFKGKPIQKVYKDLNFEVYDSMGDIYCLFYEKGLSILRNGGVLSFITSNKWMRAGYGEKLRAFFVKNNPLTLIDLGPNVFDTATVDTNILFVEKNQYKHATVSCSMKSRTEKMSDFVRQNGTKIDFDRNSWCILSPIEQSIKRKIEAIGVPLKDWNISINYGIKTGCNEAFIIDGETKDALIAQDPKSAEIIRPILRGRDIKRYSYDFADKWLIATHNGTPTQERIKIEDYPAVKMHLDSYYAKIAKRDDQGDTPYNLRCCAYWDDFSKPKIVYIEIMTDNEKDGYPFPCFAFDKNKTIALNTAYIMTSDTVNLYCLLGILNSRFGRYLLKNYVSQLQRRQYRMLAQFITAIPMPVLQIKAQEKIASIAKQQIENNTIKHANENEIDNILNSEIGLTEEESDYVYNFE